MVLKVLSNLIKGLTMEYGKDDFLKDFWGKEKVQVEADALKEDLQLIEKQKQEIASLKAKNERLKSQASYYRTQFMALQAKEPIYINLRG